MVQVHVVTFCKGSFDPSIGWGNGIAIDLSWDLHKVDVGHIQQYVILKWYYCK